MNPALNQWTIAVDYWATWFLGSGSSRDIIASVADRMTELLDQCEWDDEAALAEAKVALRDLALRSAAGPFTLERSGTVNKALVRLFRSSSRRFDALGADLWKSLDLSKLTTK